MDDLLALMDAVPCQRFNLVCIPNPDGTNHNPAALYLRHHHPNRAYISGAMDYTSLPAHPDEFSRMLAHQVSTLVDQGFDAIKLIEGKPQVRKLLPIPLDSPHYEGMWAAIEQFDLPVIFHVADPDFFWDPAACPEWARQSGWGYTDGTYPSKEDLYAEVDRILARHPRLKLILAHFYFLSQQLERATAFLDAHPTVCFDLAPHFDMYTDFIRRPQEARAFFLRYQDRIIYGTDTDTRPLLRGPEGYALMRSIPVLIRSVLEIDGPFENAHGHMHGLGLPEVVLRKIYALNFERMVGPSPRA
jgi:predicted TIM-barrel fold metal-dependent hydrolase